METFGLPVLRKGMLDLGERDAPCRESATLTVLPASGLLAFETRSTGWLMGKDKAGEVGWRRMATACADIR